MKRAACLFMIAFLLTIAAMVGATTVEYYIDPASGTDSNACGTTLPTACKTYGKWYGSSGGRITCSSDCGCGATGCKAAVDTALAAGNAVILHVEAGTLSGDGFGRPMDFPFNGTSPTVTFTMQCDAANYGCTINDTGVTDYAGAGGLIVIGASQTTFLDNDAADYVTLKGFFIQGAPPGAGAIIQIRTTTSDHIRIEGNKIDGSDNEADSITGFGQDYISIVGNWFTNCADTGASGGCTFLQDMTHLALVNNRSDGMWDYPCRGLFHWSGGSGSGHSVCVGSVCEGIGRRDLPCSIDNDCGCTGGFCATMASKSCTVVTDCQGASNCNHDNLTWQNSRDVLVDGNIATQGGDGLDGGGTPSGGDMLRSHIRWNDVTDSGGNPQQQGSHMIKISGESGKTSAGWHVFKNAFHYSAYGLYNERWSAGIWSTETASDVLVDYNTMYCPYHNFGDGSETCIGLAQTSVSSPNGDRIGWNILDGSDALPSLSTDGVFNFQINGGVLMTQAQQVWKKNVFYMPAFADSDYIAETINSDIGTTKYTAAQTATTLNSAGSNSGNVHANPGLVNRASPAVLGNLAPSGDANSIANVIDKGTAFCTADSAGSGTTITVSCQAPITDPRIVFAASSDFYLDDRDCKFSAGYVGHGGVRAVDALDTGCFTIWIEGCGNVTLTAIDTARTLTISPSCPGWASGARVHYPFLGLAPDLGAIEFGGSTTSIIRPPTLLTPNTILPNTLPPPALMGPSPMRYPHRPWEMPPWIVEALAGREYRMAGVQVPD